MKRIKYIFCAIFIMLAVLSTSELYQNYLSVFLEDFYAVTFYVQPDTTCEEMIKDINQFSKKYDIEVFFAEAKLQENNLETYKIFASSNAKTQLKKQFYIFSGEFGSIFGNQTQINYVDFMSIKEENVVTNNTFYLLGDYDNMVNFKKSLVEKYAGSFPKQDRNQNYKTLKKQLLFIWISICIVIFLLTIYDSQVQKKENFIRISLGANIHVIVIGNILLDIFFYFIVYVVSITLLKQIVGVFVFSKFQNLLFTCLCIGNSMIYINLYFYNMKKALSNQQFADKLLILNYAIKTISIICATMLLSLNIAQIYEGIRFYQQKDFYKTYKDYSYVHFLSQEDVTEIEKDFFKQYENKYDIIALGKDVYLGDNEDSGVIVANNNSRNYLIEELGLEKDKEYFDDNAIFVSDRTKLKMDEEEYLSYLIDSTGEVKPNIFYYKSNKTVLCQNHRIKRLSEWMKNPVILYITNSDMFIFEFNELLIHTSKEEVGDFLQKKQYKDNYLVENVWDVYQNHLSKVRKLILLNTILLVLIIFLEELINTVILRMEYQIHALEHATQKILGYTLYERNKKILLGTLLGNVISVIAAIVAATVLHYGHIVFILLGNVIFLLLDILLIYRFIYHCEKQNLVKILKGGSL